MKFEQAKEIGLECGLELPAEWVNNIIIHACNLFYYMDIAHELSELGFDAQLNGVTFSQVCGHAMLDGGAFKEVCYMCRGLYVERH